MLRVALLLLLLLPVQDVDGPKKALIEALTAATKNETIEAALASLAATDDERTAGALGDAYEKALDLYRAGQKDVAKFAKEMEDHKLVYDQYGRYIRGRADLFMKAEEQWRAALARVSILDQWAPKVAASILAFKTDKQLAGALKTFKTGGEFYVRGCAALRLGRSDSKEAYEALLNSLKKENDSTLRVALLDALGHRVKDDADVRALVLEAVKSGEWQVQVAACQALRKSPDKSAAPVLIPALKGATGRIRNEINEALMAVTGVDKHGDPEAWKAWWEEHGEEFMAGTYTPHPSDRAGKKGDSAFYGLPVYSTRLIFLIDTSSSMTAPPSWLPADFSANFKGQPNRLDVAKFELKKIINQLPNGCEFNIINFHTSLVPYQPKLVRMDGGGRTKALKWIDELPFGDGTATWLGIEECFRQAGGNFFAKNASGTLDTIYLMSDGVPSTEPKGQKDFIEKVVAITRFKKIVIHTIAVDPPAGGDELMKAIAEATGGMYVRR